jgi:hypothetical protein
MRRTLCSHDGSESGFCDTEEGVGVASRTHGIDSDGERSIGSVLEACVR